MELSEEDKFRDLETFARLIDPFGFPLPVEVENQFQSMHEHLRAGPDCLKHLSGERGTKWLERMNEQLFGDVREGFASVYFHVDQICQVESRIKESIERSPNEWFPPGMASRAFHCRPINFEFQAFHFAFRRSLEYVAGTTMKFFKSEGSSIRSLSNSIERSEPVEPRLAVQERLSEANLEAYIGDGSTKSVRDLLAHYYAVDPNLLNVSRSPSGELVAYFPKIQTRPSPEAGHLDLSAFLREDLNWMLDLSFGIFNGLGLLPEPWERAA